MPSRYFTDRQVHDIWNQLVTLAIRDSDFADADEISDDDELVVTGKGHARPPRDRFDAAHPDDRGRLLPPAYPAPYGPRPFMKDGGVTIDVQNTRLTIDPRSRTIKAVPSGSSADDHHEISSSELDDIIGG